MGRIDRPRSSIRTGQPPHRVVFFQQGTDYYQQKGSYYHRKNKLSKALLFFNKAIELDPDNAVNHYNLACLLSKTDRLEEANSIFKHILCHLDPELTECYFLMAVNYGLLEEMENARKHLLKYIELSPDGAMAEEARELVCALDDEEEDEQTSGYECGITQQKSEELLRGLLRMSRSEFRLRAREDKSFNQLLVQALYQGSETLKQEIIRLYGEAGTAGSKQVLQEFVLNPWVKRRLRQAALLQLKNISANGQCRLYHEGNFTEIDLAGYPIKAPVWKEEWQEVLQCALAHMNRSLHYSEEFYEDAQAIWLDFINHAYPAIPRIIKPAVWAAAIEYSVARFHFLSLTQKELADSYDVSTSSVADKFRMINKVLHIDQKAYRSMLAFLANREKEHH